VIEVKKCITVSDFSQALQLTRDYLHWIDIDLSFQDIDRELVNFSSLYGSPDGLFLLAVNNGEIAGGVGMRQIESRTCEMKRLFVYDRFKRQGVGRMLCNRLLQEARNIGYDKMRLDTLGRMTAAIMLYKALGFEEIGAYRYNPAPEAKYFEFKLRE